MAELVGGTRPSPTDWADQQGFFEYYEREVLSNVG
jgi:hypothetical protein